MKKLISLVLALALAASFAGCTKRAADPLPTDAVPETTLEETTAEEPVCRLNGDLLSEYAIVYSASALDYNQTAAEYLAEQIEACTGIALPVYTDAEQKEPLPHEIVVGETNRAISASLNAETKGFQFALLADKDHVAMEAECFVIAAAAYYFMENYIGAAPFDASVPTETSICEPITEEPKNFLFLIGDGMGPNQTKLFNTFSVKDVDAYSDGEDAFYGYMFPHIGWARTKSLSGTTDSAASGTALASGYKTKNGYVGKDKDKNDVKSLTEFAIELGKSTAVMSTEPLHGATPAAFSAHAVSRDDTADIKADQELLKATHGTRILGEYGNVYTEYVVKHLMERNIKNTLASLAENEKGFFLMFEEAYFDKNSHSNLMKETFLAGLRFNQAIGTFMEFAFYHPDTFVLITADHETGGLQCASDGTFYYTSTSHTGADVPVFAYGVGSEVFHDTTVENIQIPKTIAKMWGVDLVGYEDAKYPALVPGAK